MTEPPLECNAAMCHVCLDIVESRSVHDFRGCKCGTIFVDGGLEYIRRGWDGKQGDQPYTDYTTLEELNKAKEWKRNGLTWLRPSE